MATLADVTIRASEIAEVRALIDASRELDRAVLEFGLTHQITIGKYMAFKVALRVVDALAPEGE